MGDIFRCHVGSFYDLVTQLDGIEDQAEGLPCQVSQIGEPYVEFKSVAMARPGDEAIIEKFVADDMARRLNEYCADREGTIYWRIRFETDVRPFPVVLRFDADGPDICFETNLRCVSDKNWIRIAAYCRMVRARVKVPHDLVRKVA